MSTVQVIVISPSNCLCSRVDWVFTVQVLHATLVAVLTSRYKDKAPELMAYQRTIVRAQRTFTGEGWVTYDACYRRQAAARKTLNWSHIDFNLYS